MALMIAAYLAAGGRFDAQFVDGIDGLVFVSVIVMSR